MTPAQIETYVDAAAAALDLPLRRDHREGVLRYFALAARFRRAGRGRAAGAARRVGHELLACATAGERSE